MGKWGGGGGRGGGLGKNLKMVSLRYFSPLISKHIKNLFSKLGFYKMTF